MKQNKTGDELILDLSIILLLVLHDEISTANSNGMYVMHGSFAILFDSMLITYAK